MEPPAEAMELQEKKSGEAGASHPASPDGYYDVAVTAAVPELAPVAESVVTIS